ncbi:MAG: heavy metal translocating P-type ATPase, partial [Fusobacteria bacterium]|nr:heavy metal translocating P-type ATPase [Fusobacteriota bacterium]
MKKYKLNNLDCANCALKLEKHIKELENVNSVTIDFATLTMHLDSTNDIYAINKIKELEPEIIPILHNNTDNAHNYEHDYKNINLKKEIIALIVSILFLILSFFFNQYSILKIDISTIILFIGYLISGYNIIKKAIINIIKGQIFDENFLMFIATIGAFLIKAPIEALSVMIFYNLGELFQNIALSKSRKSIKSL